MVGKFNKVNNGIPPHLDEDDIISCIITSGSPNNDGDTNYCNGFKTKYLELNKFWFSLNIADYKLDVTAKFIWVFVLGVEIELH